MMKPVPPLTAETEPFWRACADGHLTFQRCEPCGHAQFYPRSICARCRSPHLAWQRSTGRGRIHSFTVVHRAPSAAFKADVPYVVALVDIAEGFRMLMNVISCDPETVRIDMPVEIVFEPRGEMRLPQARPGTGDV